MPRGEFLLDVQTNRQARAVWTQLGHLDASPRQRPRGNCSPVLRLNVDAVGIPEHETTRVSRTGFISSRIFNTEFGSTADRESCGATGPSVL